MEALHTDFAPAERATPEKLREQVDCIKALPWVVRFLDATSTLALVLNSYRQIVFATRGFIELIQTCSCCHEAGDIVGMRPGELLECVHADENGMGGCGTTVFCRSCGAVKAILQSQQGMDSVEECRMSRKNAKGETEAMDLRVWARPFKVKEEFFTVMTVADITDEKRRIMLERIFFHDLINTAGSVNGLARMLAETSIQEETVKSLADLLCCSSEQLIDEIEAHRTVNSAEHHDLVVHLRVFEVMPLLQRLLKSFSAHDVARNRKIVIAQGSANAQIESDPVLLQRVITNLLKNALEASEKGQSVTIGVTRQADLVSVSLQNDLVMPETVRNQVFNRSFSTKGAGRGLGTYSARLLTERYLGGRIDFESKAGLGTVFTVVLPIKMPKPVENS